MTIPSKTDKVIKMYLDTPHHGTWIWEREDGTYYAQLRYKEITYYNVHKGETQWIFDEQINE